MSTLFRVPTYGMQQRSDRPDFYIRDKRGRPALTMPHRHDYFQIQINLGGDTVQHIGGAIRPFPANTLAFILPHRLHLIPHPEDSNFVLINFSQGFFLPRLHCDPLDLEDVSLEVAPELAPFQLQEYMDFTLDDQAFAQVRALIDRMRELDQGRGFGVQPMLHGCLLQLLGWVMGLYAVPMQALAMAKATHQGRQDALARVMKYIRTQICSPKINLKDAAQAAFVSPNYLTHLLRKETGSTFSELILERRMRLARTYLLNGEQTVAQIAQSCGFSDEAYFSRRFRKAHGLPPGQFRREQRGNSRP